MKELAVIETVKNGGVFALNSSDFEGRRMTINEVVAILSAFDAFWQYQGDPCVQKPHALLKSGKHSNGFINCKEVLDYPLLCMLLAHEMLKEAKSHLAQDVLATIGGVAASAYSALDPGFCLAWLLSKEYNHRIKAFKAEKDDKGNPTIIRGGIDPSLNVLVINELMTTASGSTWETKQAVLKTNGDKPAPKVLDKAIVLMHRSKDFQLPDGSLVVPVFHFDIENFEPENCPYCQVGSQAIKPKVGNNWNILHGWA
ncbi:MAG: hypothetical protein NTZ49_05245 [Candidatus Parcubacteria bacterium]|nr:hypothetical protein [Candidatus Parcubacteria bacterium]